MNEKQDPMKSSSVIERVLHIFVDKSVPQQARGMHRDNFTIASKKKVKTQNNFMNVLKMKVTVPNWECRPVHLNVT